MNTVIKDVRREVKELSYNSVSMLPSEIKRIENKVLGNSDIVVSARRDMEKIRQNSRDINNVRSMLIEEKKKKLLF